MTDIQERGYTSLDVLVSTDWVAQNLENPEIRIIESNEDPLLYPSGHIPGAVEVDWTRDLNQPIRRDYLNKEGFEELMSRIGARRDTTLIFYGDNNNWWACYAFWVFQLFGHANAKVMDGGRLKWEKESRPMTKDVPSYPKTQYEAQERDDTTYRVFRNGVLGHIETQLPLVDVRSEPEYTGERLHMENYPNEGALRGGHIPCQEPRSGMGPVSRALRGCEVIPGKREPQYVTVWSAIAGAAIFTRRVAAPLPRRQPPTAPLCSCDHGAGVSGSAVPRSRRSVPSHP